MFKILTLFQFVSRIQILTTVLVKKKFHRAAGSYELLDEGLEAAAEAFDLPPEDVQMVKNVG